MKWSELKRLAVSRGFQFVAHRKKHDEYYNPRTGITIMIERHESQEVRKGLMMRLKRQIEL